MAALSATIIGSTSEEFAARLAAEVKMWSAVAKLVDIKFEQ